MRIPSRLKLNRLTKIVTCKRSIPLHACMDLARLSGGCYYLRTWSWQGCLGVVTTYVHGAGKVVRGLLLLTYMELARVSGGCCHLQGAGKGVRRLLQGCYKVAMAMLLVNNLVT